MVVMMIRPRRLKFYRPSQIKRPALLDKAFPAGPGSRSSAAVASGIQCALYNLWADVGGQDTSIGDVPWFLASGRLEVLAAKRQEHEPGYLHASSRQQFASLYSGSLHAI